MKFKFENLRTKLKSASPSISGHGKKALLRIFPKSDILLLLLLPADHAFGSVESSLSAVQDKLVGTLLPLAAICGLVFAGFSFVAGRPNARSHLALAIMGAIVGFGAESIVSLIRSLIH